jgi:hypothetical protein
VRTGRLSGVRLQRKHAAVLIGVAAWNVVTWTTFARNLSQTEGRPTGFYVAHTGLIVVNIAIAAVLGSMGFRAWRAARSGSAR